jgi:serine/threonine protein kinase
MRPSIVEFHLRIRMTLQPGEIIHNRYRIESIIAQGGMGAVYLARDLSLDIPVAVKENLGGTESYARQFRREGTVLAGLVHPNLPRVTDHFVSESGSQYLVMDFIAGEDLREMIKHLGPLPEDLVIRVGVTICEALTYLHTHQPPILHRDIKPGNIKISPDGEIYLVDFGLVKIVQGSGATTTGAQSLTPGYAPPEQYGGGTDQRSDIYSLGATLYAALTGKIPEDGISRAMGNSHLTKIIHHRPALNSRLAEIIEKALSIEPEKRFQTAADLQETLIAILLPTEKTKDTSSLSPTVSSNSVEPGHPAKSEKSKTGQVIGIAAVVILFIALVATAESVIRTYLSPAASAATRLPVLETRIPPTDFPSRNVPTETKSLKVPAVVPSASPEIPTIAASTVNELQGTIAFASDREGVPQIFIMNLIDNTLRQLTNLPSGACQPDWSPTGDQLVIVTPCKSEVTPHKNASLFLIDADGNGLSGLKTMPGGDYDPDWSPDGKQIAFTSLRDSTGNIVKTFIYTLDLVGLKTTRLLKTTPNQQNPQFSPDGSKIIFEMYPTNNPQIYIIGSNGASPTQITSLSEGAMGFPSWSPDGSRAIFTKVSQTPTLLEKEITSPRSKSEKVNGISRPAKNGSYSPDGKWLIFESEGDIWIIPAAGGEAINLTSSEARDFDPAWKP